jgi:hypothetical protein
MKTGFRKTLLRPLPSLVLITFLLGGCGTSFPRPDDVEARGSLSGQQIFQRSLNAQTRGNKALRNVSYETDGSWEFLVTKVQPLITDEPYRMKGQEFIDLESGNHTALFSGPAGTKKIIRTTDTVAVYYNGQQSKDDDVLKVAAMTADASSVFYLGPAALAHRKYQFTRLSDIVEDGQIYYRIYSVVEPGFGFSERDEVVFWMDRDSFQVYRTHITLEGFRTTRGAHVDVTNQAYREVDGHTFASEFFERVRGPLALDVHHWWMTSIEVNKGKFTGAAID